MSNHARARATAAAPPHLQAHERIPQLAVHPSQQPLMELRHRLGIQLRAEGSNKPDLRSSSRARRRLSGSTLCLLTSLTMTAGNFVADRASAHQHAAPRPPAAHLAVHVKRQCLVLDGARQLEVEQQPVKVRPLPRTERHQRLRCAARAAQLDRCCCAILELLVRRQGGAWGRRCLRPRQQGRRLYTGTRNAAGMNGWKHMRFDKYAPVAPPLS